jgi:hypothetical protein
MGAKFFILQIKHSGIFSFIELESLIYIHRPHLEEDLSVPKHNLWPLI